MSRRAMGAEVQAVRIAKTIKTGVVRIVSLLRLAEDPFSNLVSINQLCADPNCFSEGWSQSRVTPADASALETISQGRCIVSDPQQHQESSPQFQRSPELWRPPRIPWVWSICYPAQSIHSRYDQETNAVLATQIVCCHQ